MALNKEVPALTLGNDVADAMSRFSTSDGDKEKRQLEDEIFQRFSHATHATSMPQYDNDTWYSGTTSYRRRD